MNSARKQETSPIAAAAAVDAASFVEEGEAFRALVGGPRPAPRERLDVVVIGGGQAGLATGYYLARRNLRFVVLDASPRVGDAWRRRWDSLRLFSPARFDGLPGMAFPAPGDSFPTKDEMADYLEAYAARFELPVRTGVAVERVSRRGTSYVVTAGDVEFEADHVIVAMASYQRPRVPGFAKDLRPDIVQLHSFDYRSPSQLREGGALVVGAGNSGAEIAVELVKRGHATRLSGKDVGHVPFRSGGLIARLLLRFVFRVVFHRLLSVRTPVGRRAQAKRHEKAAPLVRTRPVDLRRAGVERLPRVVGVRDGLPLLEDGRVLDVTNVVWCTGFDPGLSWIDCPIFDAHGEPRHDCGVVPDEPGLYFVGQHFLYSLSSSMVHGVGRDAARIVETLASRILTTRRTT
jgi:putative flavoprotein involved in K+ transport